MHFHCHWINFPIYQKVQNFTAVFQRKPFGKKVSPNAVDPIRIACAHVMLRFVIRNFLTADVILQKYDDRSVKPMISICSDIEKHCRWKTHTDKFTTKCIYQVTSSIHVLWKWEDFKWISHRDQRESSDNHLIFFDVSRKKYRKPRRTWSPNPSVPQRLT